MNWRKMTPDEKRRFDKTFKNMSKHMDDMSKTMGDAFNNQMDSARSEKKMHDSIDKMHAGACDAIRMYIGLNSEGKRSWVKAEKDAIRCKINGVTFVLIEHKENEFDDAPGEGYGHGKRVIFDDKSYGVDGDVWMNVSDHNDIRVECVKIVSNGSDVVREYRRYVSSDGTKKN